MKKIIILAVFFSVMLQSQAQVIYYSTPLWYPYHSSETTKQTATVTTGVLGLAEIVGNTIVKTQEIKAQKEAQARYDAEKVQQKAHFPQDIATADGFFNAGDYSAALQAYAKCAHNNDNYEQDLGDQDYLVKRIEECNEKVGNASSQPSVANNAKARKSDYSAYTVDIENPVYKSKKKNNYAAITRISCNDKETRIEFEYFNNFKGEVGLGIKGDTYIKGKKSGKLKMRRVENITIAPAKTTVSYGHQTLKFALVFPALDSRDETISFREPSSEWQFDDLICK